MNGVSNYVSKGMVVFKLLFPTAVLRWVVIAMLTIFFAALAVKEFLQWELAGAVVLIACINLGLICIFTMPTQMVTLASSRTTSYLGNVRSLLFVSLLVFSLLLTLAICWGWNFTQPNYYSSLMLLGVWLVSSLILQASVLISSRLPGIHLFLLVFFAILNDAIRWLELYSPLLIALIIVLSWAFFAWWWLNWCPVKYRVNPFFIGRVAQQKMALERRSNFWFFSGSAKSWLGSRLAGSPDGLTARSKSFLPGLVITPLGFVPGYIIMGEAWFKSFVHFFFLFFAVGVAQMVQSNYALNVSRIWLYSPGNRNELFSLLQKRFWSDVLPFTLAFASTAFGLNFFSDAWRGAEARFYFMLSLFLMQLLVFHAFWWAYQRTQANLVLSNLLSGGLVLWWFLMSIATGFLIKFPVSWQDLSPLWIVIPQCALLVMFYKPVQQGFARVSLARAG